MGSSTERPTQRWESPRRTRGWSELKTRDFWLGKEPLPQGSRFTVEFPLWSIWKRAVEPAGYALLGQLEAIAGRY